MKICHIIICGKPKNGKNPEAPYQLAEKEVIQGLLQMHQKSLNAGYKVSTFRGYGGPAERTPEAIEGYVRSLQLRQQTGFLPYQCEQHIYGNYSYFVTYNYK